MTKLPLLTKGLTALAADLVESYPGTTEQTIRTAWENWRANRPADGIVEMFAYDSFAKRPEIFGRQDANPPPASGRTDTPPAGRTPEDTFTRNEPPRRTR